MTEYEVQEFVEDWDGDVVRMYAQQNPEMIRLLRLHVEAGADDSVIFERPRIRAALNNGPLTEELMKLALEAIREGMI
jgi:hypothetical protein